LSLLVAATQFATTQESRRERTPTPLAPTEQQAPAMADDESKEEKKPDAEAINLKVVTQDGNEIYFKCKMTTPLQKLMNAFCQRNGVTMQSVRFLFDGARLGPQQTPKDLDMEDGDVIDVMVEQQGGC